MTTNGLFDKISAKKELRELVIQESLEYIALALCKIADIKEAEYNESHVDITNIFTSILGGNNNHEESDT